MSSMLSKIKSCFVPAGKKPRTIKTGPFKGIRLNLDLQYQTQMWLGLQERELHSCLHSIGSKLKTGVDVGSMDGEYALYFLRQPNMKHVFACDPSTPFPENLATNLALNGFTHDPRITGVNKFISDQTSENHCTLDSLAADLEGPCAVKIDVDGGEGDVLRGAEKMLTRRDVYWILETHTAELERECEQVFRSKKLKTRIIDKAWWRAIVPELREIPHNRWMVAWSEAFEK